MLEIEAYGIDNEHVADVRGIPGVYHAALDDRGATQVLTVQSELGADPQESALRILKDVRIRQLSTRSPSLEDAYVAIVGEANTPSAPLAAGVGR